MALPQESRHSLVEYDRPGECSLTERLLLQVTEVSTTCAKVINTCQSYVWTQKGLTEVLTDSLFTNVTQGWMQKRLIKTWGGVQLVYTDEANNVHPSSP